jgi:cobalt/nickel transport system permease protein
LLEEDFITGDSIIHRMDPRARLIACVLFAVVVALSDRFSSLLPALLVSFFLVWLSGLPIKAVISRLLVLNAFLLLLWFFIPFTAKGDVLFRIGPLTVTLQGIVFAAQITIKANAIMLALIVLLATMSVFTLGGAMGHLLVPGKIVHLVFFTYRYIQVIHQEYDRLINAVKIRGFHPGNNIHTYKTFAYLVGMLLVKSYDRAERIRAAMLCRGFRGRFYNLSEFSLGPLDVATLFFMFLAIAGIGTLEWAL